MFTPEIVSDLASRANLDLDAATDFPNEVENSEYERTIRANIAAFTDNLNGMVKTFMPEGAPSLTLSTMQAELIRDLLAPGWAMQSIKIAAFEALAHLPLYAKQFGTKQSYDEINQAREALAQMNYVLSSITMHQPVVETNHFIQFLRDPQTKIVASLYNHLLALQYADKLARAWQQIPVFAPGEAN